MKGLLMKEFYIIKSGILIPLFSTTIIGIALARMQSPWLLITIVAASLSIMAVTSISTDKITQWDKFSATLPVSKGQIISSKYLLYLILSILGIAIGTGASMIAAHATSGFHMDDLTFNLLLAIVSTILPATISIPLTFILDEEKGIAGAILSYVVAAVLFAGIRYLLTDVLKVQLEIVEVFGMFAIISIGLFFLSWIIFVKKSHRLIF